MIAPLLLAAIITRGPVVSVKPPATVTDSWLCSHVSVFFCPIFPKLDEPASRSQRTSCKIEEAVKTSNSGPLSRSPGSSAGSPKISPGKQARS